MLPRADGRLPDELRAGATPPTDEELAAWTRLPPGTEQFAPYGAVPIAPAATEEFYLRTFADTSLDINGFASGSPDLVKTVLPVEARANVSIRLAPGQDPDEISAVFERRVRDALPEGAELEIELRNRARPAMTDSATARVQLAADAFEDTSSVRARSSFGPVARSRSTRGSWDGGSRRSRPASGSRASATSTRRTRTCPKTRSASASRPCARSSDGSESLASASFVSPLAEELADDVLARFLRYVRVDTQAANRVLERPSTEKQLDLSRMLVDELQESAWPTPS